MRRKSEDFAAVLREIRSQLRMTQGAFGAHIGAAPRTLTRWEIHGELPPVAQRTYMAMKLAGLIPAERLEELVEAMDIGSLVDGAALSAGARSAVDREAARAALERALLAMAEDLDMSPRKVRPALVKVLAEVEATGLPLAEARAALSRSDVER